MSATISDSLEARRRQRMVMLWSRAEREGAKLQFWSRTISTAVVAVVLAALFTWNAGLLFILAALAGFFLIGLVQYWLIRAGYRPVRVGVVAGTLDMILLTALIVLPNPFASDALPPALAIRQGGFKYLLILVCLGALTLSPRLAAWLGFVAAASWSIAVAWVASQPGVTVMLDGAAPNRPASGPYFDPNVVDIANQVTHVVVILIITGIIALVVSRSRHLAIDYVRAERARGNLARHFSPNVVDELASADEPFGPVRRQEAGVLFADIVGFTNFAEDNPPERVFELLREFHRRMEQAIFDNGGTVDNYIGDSVMAIFGLPRRGKDDASRTLACAREIAAAIAAWNRQRAAAGLPEVDARIGCQYGPAVLGAVGSERILSFSLVGDTVNVASRLQTITRDLDARICVGSALVEAVRREGGEALLEGLVDRGPVHLRNRDNPVGVWVLPLQPAPTVPALAQPG
jgi:adenylate cyclase